MKDPEIFLLPSAPYKKMYMTLFHAITDALELLEEDHRIAAVGRLKQAQQEAEELYLSQE